MKKTAIAITAVWGIIVVLFFMHNKPKPPTMLKPPAASMQDSLPVAVNVTPVKKMSIDESIDLTGNLEPWKEISIAAESQGKIEKINFDIGQRKKKGDILVTIDSELKMLSVETAKANTAKLKNDLDRTENLFKGGTVSRQQLDESRFAYETALLQQKQSEKQLSDATLRSPLTGLIIGKYVEQGSYINIGSPVATIIDISKLKVKLNVSETNVYKLNIGDKVSVSTDIYPGFTYDGSITFISSKGEEGHNFPVEITISNNNEHQLKAGTLVSVHINMHNTEEQIYIPRQSLVGSTRSAGVYTIHNGKALLKQVTIGNQTGEYFEVSAGISEGDTIVTAGQINLSDGKAVSIVAK